MNNEQQERHEMILKTTHPSGAEEWSCPTCGRRFLMQWPPNYKKVILQEGDESAIHTGGKGGLQITNLATGPHDHEQAPATPMAEAVGSNEGGVLTDEDELRLLSWEKWLDKLDLDNRLSKKD